MSRTVYALWHGGSGYTWGDADNVEAFPSLAAVRDAMVDRERNGHTFEQTFRFAHRDHESYFTPDVGPDDSMTVWLSEPTTDDFGVRPRSWAEDAYPDLIFERGPRGGIQQTTA